jgi:hypothetical protein
MATDFDQFPLYDPIVKKNTNNLSDVWVGSISTFYMNLIGYLTAGGILIPRLTTAQRDQLQNVQEGQFIYNTDATPGPPRSAAIQVWQVKSGIGAWYTFTTT